MINEDLAFRYYVEDGKLKIIYKDEFVKLRIAEMKTGKKDPYLERVRKAWANEAT